MFTHTTPSIESGALFHPGPRFSLARTWRRGLRTLDLWYSRHEERRALASLTADQLRDIGVGEAEARLEAAKPFWRA